MTTTEFQTLLHGQDYDFLRTNKHLGKNILFLTLGGSNAYGTNATNSDVDVRGVAGSPDILGFNHFEQVIDNKTDTVIFAIGKFVSMLVQCNPNIIELLGNDPELYVNMTPEGKMLLYGVLLYSNVYEDLMHSMLLRPDHLRDDIFCWQIQTTSNLRQRLGYVPDKHD